MKNKMIWFPEVNKAELTETEFEMAPSGMVLVETKISTISCGTERANITGNPHTSIDSDETQPAIFPRYAGYSSAGVVIAKSPDVTSVEVGDRVAMGGSMHQKYNMLPEKNVVKIEYDNVSYGEAAMNYISTFSMAAVRKTRIEIGESALVMGLGILGLLSVSFAKAAGAVPVIAVDPVAERREKALSAGADFALDPMAPDFVETVKKLTDGGAHAVIEVTGLGIGLNQALDCVRRFGRIAMLGCTRDKNFTVDYYRKVHGPGVTIIGAHTMARPSFESSPHAFTQRDDVKTFLKLVAMGRVNVKDLIDEVNSPVDCPSVYERLINDRNFPAIAQFDWTTIEV